MSKKVSKKAHFVVNLFIFASNINTMNDIIKQLLHVNSGQNVTITSDIVNINEAIKQMDAEHLYACQDLGNGTTKVKRLGSRSLRSPLIIALMEHKRGVTIGEVAYTGSGSGLRASVSRFNLIHGTRYRVRKSGVNDGEMVVYLKIEDRKSITESEFESWDKYYQERMGILQLRVQELDDMREQMLQKLGISKMPFLESDDMNDDIMEVDYEDEDEII